MVKQSMKCIVDDCNGTGIRRGYCSKHYKRLMRHGDPLKGGAFRTKLDNSMQCVSEGCTKPQAVAHLGLCNGCYLRFCRNGSIERSRQKKGATLRWLCSLSLGHEGCIVFPYSDIRYPVVGITGYGQVSAHRFVCELFHGEPPDGFYALHTCGNGHLGCVNPDHLVWGDQRTNGLHRIIHNQIGRGHDACLVLTQRVASFGYSTKLDHLGGG